MVEAAAAHATLVFSEPTDHRAVRAARAGAERVPSGRVGGVGLLLGVLVRRNARSYK